MDEEKQLLLQEGLLVQELELIRAKIKYVRLFKSEQQKVINEPCKETYESKTTLEQPASSKEISNPVKVDDLPKIMTEVQTSKTLVTPSDFILKPNGGIQIPKITKGSETSYQDVQGIQIPNTNSKAYYAVFNGPAAGIYSNWTDAEIATKGISGIKHKKYKSFAEAKTAADIYCRTQGKRTFRPYFYFGTSET